MSVSQYRASSAARSSGNSRTGPYTTNGGSAVIPVNSNTPWLIGYNSVDSPTILPAFLGIRFRRPAGRQGEQRLLSGEHPFLVGPPLPVGHPHGKHPVHPTLQDGWQTEPPERELKHQDIAPSQLVHLRLHLRHKPVVLRRVEFLLLLFEVGGVAHRGKVASVRDRVPTHRVQVGHDDLLPPRPEMFDRRFCHRCVETVWLVVGMNDEDFHLPTTAGIC